MAEPAESTRQEDHQPARPARARPFARGVLHAAALGAVVTLAFFLPALQPDRQFGYFDNGRMHVPMKRYLAEELRAGRLPEWNPYAGLGTPLIAGGVDAVLHPFNALFLVLPFELAFKLWLLLFYPVAASGAFAWARRLGAGFGGAVTAGLVFALSGYAVSLSGNMQYLAALALFPWILASAHAFVERPTPGRGALVAIASGLCAASGDPQGWGIAVALVPAAVLAAPPAEGRGRGMLRAGAAVGLAVAGAAPSLFPMLLWIPNSGRGEAFDAYEYEHFNLLPARALEFVIPHLFRTTGRHLASALYEAYSGNRLTPFPWALSEYVGISVVALAVLGAVRARSARILIAAAAIFAWMAMGPRAGFGQIARHLPVLSSLRYWEKLAIWPALFLALAAAFGLGALYRSRDDARRTARVVTPLGLAFLAAAGAFAVFPGLTSFAVPGSGAPELAAAVAENLRDGLFHAGAFSVALGLAMLLLAVNRLPWPALVIAVICVLDVAAANVRAYVLYDVASNHPPSPVGARLREEPGLQRLTTPFGMFTDSLRHDVELETAWRVGAAAQYSAWNVPWRVANFEIYSGMRPVRSNRFWRRTGRKDRLPDLGVWGVQWVWVPPDAGPGSHRFLPSDRTPVPLEESYGTLFHIRARPRVYLAASLESVDRRSAMNFALLPDKAATSRSVVEGPIPDDYQPPSGTARIAIDEPERLDIATETDREALLVVNDEYTTGWSASVDGRPSEIVPVNYLVRGVWVGPGKHRVLLTYRTPGLRLGIATALGAAMLLAGWALWRRRDGGAADAS